MCGLGDRRVLRSMRWLLENNSPRDEGRFYDCGASRDGTGYREVTTSTDPEVLAIKKRFKEILKGLPAPILPKEVLAKAGTRRKKAKRRQ